MILNAPLCDYLRLTSFKSQDYTTFLNHFNFHAEEVSRTTANRMQYDGLATGHGFVGSGTQKRRKHYLTEFSGAPAHLAYVWLIASELLETRCTRIDVQCTIDLPEAYDARQVFDEFSGKLPHSRQMTLYQSPGGLDTIYMGSRKTKNGRFTRLYVKEHATGMALRFETEIKGNWAHEYWTYLRTGGELHEILIAELESLGNTDFEPFKTFYGLVGGYLPAPRPTRVETSNPKLDWLMNTCEPVIRQLLNDHDHGWKVRCWLEGLLDWSR